MADRKPGRVYSPAEKRAVHPNEITDLVEVVGRVPKLMAMRLTKLLKRPTNPGKVKITGKRVRKSVRTQPTSSGFSTGRSLCQGGLSTNIDPISSFGGTSQKVDLAHILRLSKKQNGL